MAFPPVIDVADPWWKSRTHQQREEVRAHFAKFGVVADDTFRIEVEGDRLVVWTWHNNGSGRHVPCDQNEGDRGVCAVRTVR